MTFLGGTDIVILRKIYVYTLPGLSKPDLQYFKARRPNYQPVLTVKSQESLYPLTLFPYMSTERLEVIQ